MRLTKIKLAGFKSFVDPTQISLHSNLVGVVGPNGCGKSNVIDAVRWVMGETSAKHLRGDSMADVIFNGSTQRKPVGQASVELLFDNSDKKLGGQYAQYNEISVKRIVSRDGSSNYYLNSSRCRRKDITDIFLGTGLGPRSYAIIEQGMISRLIEARPEELRNFIEEAAGISKYKERRRETGNRISHTRENLERLLDLRDEVEKQLEKLKRQARAAERFKVLKEEERLLRAQLLVLKLTRMQQELQEIDRRISEQEIAYEKEVAELRRIEADLEKGREQQIEATDAFNEVQGEYYRVGSDIARIEQNIQHAKERRQQLRLDLQQVEKGIAESESHLDMDQRQIADLSSQLEDLEPRVAGAQEMSEESSAQLEAAEQAMQEWQQAWETFNHDNALKSREMEVQRTTITHREEHAFKAQQRLLRLQEELGGLTLDTLAEEISVAESSQQESGAQQQELQEKLQDLLREIGDQRHLIQDVSRELDGARSRVQQQRGRYASLEALQQAALGKNDSGVTRWLEHHGLGGAKRLAEGLEVAPGWERAVETVLGFNLEAVCTSGLDPVASVLHTLDAGSLAVFDTDNQVAVSPESDATLLSAKIRSPWAVHSLLGNVYAAADLATALHMRQSLHANASVITPEGVWIGPNWLKVARDADARAGVIEREQELKHLHQEIAELVAHEAELVAALEHNRDALQSKEDEREELQEAINQVNRQLAEIKSLISGKRAHYEQTHQRDARVRAEATELEQQIAADEAQMSGARLSLEGLINELEILSQQREQLVQERDSRSSYLQEARDQARRYQDTAHELAVKIQSARTALETSRQSLERVQSQIEQLYTRRDSLQDDMRNCETPVAGLEEILEGLLSQRLEVEAKLNQARQHMEEIEHTMRNQATQRNLTEQQSRKMKDAMDESRFAVQELRIRSQTMQEQLLETGHELAGLQDTMPEEAAVEPWQERITEIESKIQKLGPINLAAIDEFQEQLQRKEYLDSQHADLTEALDTLENAISKIDKETKSKFEETYERVNTGLKEKFPRVFGGGSAYLELTEDDLLTAGVTVMARPPGKRNSTIHLLSGGEKALTAIALVFSIFDLNPAPFCLLDEVDAPLDDANVNRYCNLIREMADRTQFIFITHNKITMEMADQLNGVTMQEPGVSRLVAVDVDEAVELAAV